MTLTTKKIVENAFLAAIYFVLTLTTFPLSYGLIQFRLSELLMLLCFFRKDFVIGLTIGCFLSNLAGSGNIFGTAGYLDAVIGSSATLLAGLIMPYTKRLFIASLIPCITNGLIVGAELTFLFGVPEASMYYVSFGYVFLGEFVCISIIGYIILMVTLKKSRTILDKLDVKINLNAKW